MYYLLGLFLLIRHVTNNANNNHYLGEFLRYGITEQRQHML